MQPKQYYRMRRINQGKGRRPFSTRESSLISLFEIDGDDYDDTYCELLGTGKWLANTGRHSFGRQVTSQPYIL
ncbi:hypothetical protein [Brevibacillus dissolubilis]|uniref:hypothetical protein n=1 Tax=Brevibacillus dissolubilis TaxID=1844116 RepID=UPI001115DDEA|nr:hypothetical protein [Brevibacillus dissolubilis]